MSFVFAFTLYLLGLYPLPQAEGNNWMIEISCLPTTARPYNKRVLLSLHSIIYLINKWKWSPNYMMLVNYIVTEKDDSFLFSGVNFLVYCEKREWNFVTSIVKGRQKYFWNTFILKPFKKCRLKRTHTGTHK